MKDWIVKVLDKFGKVRFSMQIPQCEIQYYAFLQAVEKLKEFDLYNTNLDGISFRITELGKEEDDEVITDNSKVNQNLLKENEELKDTLDKIEFFCQKMSKIDFPLNGKFSEGYTQAFNEIIEEFYSDKNRLEAEKYFEQMSPGVRSELKKMLK